MGYYICKDLRGYTLFIPQIQFKIVEHLRIFICNKKTHIEPYNIRVCVNGVFLTAFDKLPLLITIHIFEKYHTGESYKVSDIFDALYQIHGVIYNIESDSDSDSDSFHSIESE